MLTEKAFSGKAAGSEVTGGSINGEGLLKFRATRVGEETALSG
jgi:cation transport ATPase